MDRDGTCLHIAAPDPGEVRRLAGPQGKGEVCLRLEFRLRMPLVEWQGLKTVDAPLSWAAVEQARYRGDADPIASQHDTGLAWLQTPTARCPKASAIEVEIERTADGAPARGPTPYPYIKFQSSRVYSRAWATGLLAKRPPRFDGQRGATAAGLFVQRLVQPDRLLAYVVADGVKGVERLLELLPYLTHIGKLRRLDLGAVGEIRVTTDEAAQTAWRQRPLPIDTPVAERMHAMVEGTSALCAPYYDRRRHVRALVPLGDI